MTLTMPLASMSKVTSIWGTPRGAGGMPVRSKRPSDLVVRRHFALALQHMNRHRGLVVLGGGEDLALPGRDGGVALDQPGHDAAQRLDAQRQRGHVQQQNVLDVALQHAALDGGADGDHFVRIDALVRLLAEICFTASCTLGMRVMPPTRMTSSISPAVTPASFSACLHGPTVCLDQVVDQAFQLGAGELDGQVLGTAGIGGDEGQVDFGLHGRSTVRSWPFRPLPSAAAAPACRCADRCRCPS